MAVQFQSSRALIKHSSDPLPPFKVGGVNFDYLPRGGSEKLKKGWKYGAGVGLLKSVG